MLFGTFIAASRREDRAPLPSRPGAPAHAHRSGISILSHHGHRLPAVIGAPRPRRGQGSAVLPGKAPGELTRNQRRWGSRGLEGRGTLIGGDSGNKSVSCGFARSNSGGCPSVCRHGCILLAWLRHGGLRLLLGVCRCWPSECSWLADVRYSNIWVVIMQRLHTQLITPHALPIR
jgi:hypothetical protein